MLAKLGLRQIQKFGSIIQVRNTTSVKYFGKIKDPVGFEKADDVSLSIVAALGNQDARRERLLREIMSVDKISRQDAFPMFREIVEFNRKGLLMATLPQRLGIAIAVSSSILCLPAVFDRNFVMWVLSLTVQRKLCYCRYPGTKRFGNLARSWSICLELG